MRVLFTTIKCSLCAAFICGSMSCSSSSTGTSQEQWVTIGVVDDSPDLYALLEAAGVKHVEDGSVIYDLLVPESDAERATELLMEHRVGKSLWWFRNLKEVKKEMRTNAERP